MIHCTVSTNLIRSIEKYVVKASSLRDQDEMIKNKFKEYMRQKILAM